MLHVIAATLTIGLIVTPALADEFTDAIDSALAAYKERDLKATRQELDYAVSLINGMKAEMLGKLLPEPLPGWTRESVEGEDAGMAMAMFGGGTTASATYTKGTEDITITLVADSPMVMGLGGMLAGLASANGKPLRINRTQFALNEGELQGVVDNKVMVSVSGSASQADKIAQIEAMDFEALGDF